MAPCYRVTGATACQAVLLWALTNQEHRVQAILRSVADPGLLNSLETLLHDEILDGEMGGDWTGSRFRKTGCRLPGSFDESSGQDDLAQRIRRE